MKKFIFSIFLISLLFACQNDQVESLKSKPNYLEITANLNKAYGNTFQVALKSKNSLNAIKDYLKTEVYNGNINFDAIQFENRAGAARAKVNEEIDISFLTAGQQLLAEPFLKSILSLDSLDNPSQAELIIQEFNQEVISSSLTEEEKYQLISIGSSIYAGVQIVAKISEAISNQELKNSGGRVAGIRWSTKDALRAGVQGLAAGGLSGLYVGCTGGTVALPGFGTAAGCVGGAVFGAAYGFVGGIGSYAVSRVLWGWE